MENPLLKQGPSPPEPCGVPSTAGTPWSHRGQFVMDFAPSDNMAAKVKYMRPAESAEEPFLKAWRWRKTPPRGGGCRVLSPGAGWNRSTLPPTSTWERLPTSRTTPGGEHHRQATAPTRSLPGCFDLGNVLDETGGCRRRCAPTASHHPGAHLRRRALQPGAGLRKNGAAAQGAWSTGRAYVRGWTRAAWAVHARNQIQKIRMATAAGGLPQSAFLARPAGAQSPFPDSGSLNFHNEGRNPMAETLAQKPSAPRRWWR
jgi:hypothetical protein